VERLVASPRGQADGNRAVPDGEAGGNRRRQVRVDRIDE
jgi:hypothetical protein